MLHISFAKRNSCFLNDGIDVATNGKWVSRRLLTCGLGFNLIMVLLVRLFANKVKRQSALFCKMGGYGFVCNQFNFQAADVFGFIHLLFQSRMR